MTEILPPKDPIRVVIVGHVDHGKSTFIGRFLYDTGNLTMDKKQELEGSKEGDSGKMEFAHVMDQFREEREQNITIDTAQTFFELSGQPYIFVDAPGHKEYLKNMITGATQARNALLLLDIQEGIKEQTEKHALILKMLGITKVAVLINKMDLVGFDEKKYTDLAQQVRDLLKGHNYAVEFVIPISAQNGDNIASPSSSLSWFKGPTVLDFVQSLKVETGTSKNEGEALFPVQFQYSVDGNDLALGRIEKGTLSENQTLNVFPSGNTVKIEKIRKYTDKVTSAGAGESIGLELKTSEKIDRGVILTTKPVKKTTSQSFLAQAFWASNETLKPQDEIQIECRTQMTKGKIKNIQDEFGGEARADLKGGDIGLVNIDVSSPLFLNETDPTDPFSRVVFHQKGRVTGCGIVRKVTSAITILVLATSPGWSYIDPGSGMAFVSGIGAWILALFAFMFGAISLFFKNSYKKVIGFFKKLFRIQR